MLKPGKIRCMLEISSTNVGTEPMAEIDREITPILAELIALGLENNEHPTANKYFNWLVTPERTGEEFYYVVGPLHEYVLDIMVRHFQQYIDPMGYQGIPAKYPGKIAIEALAAKCPVLEGPWEQAAWVLLRESTRNSPEDYGYPSDQFTAWIFHVIGNPVLCPNPCLRYELIHLLAYLVEPLKHKSFRPKAVESILSACSFLNIDYLLESKPQRDYYHFMDMDSLMECLNCITIDIEEEFDTALAVNLQNVKKFRLSAQVHDVACHYAVNCKKFEEPNMLYGLIAILQTIYDSIKLNYRDLQNENAELFSPYTGISCTTNWLKVFINNFTKICRTPHLISLTVTCILNTMEILIPESTIFTISETAIRIKRDSLEYIRNMLEDLFDEKINNPDYESPEMQNATLVWNIAKYKNRLNHLQINFC